MGSSSFPPASLPQARERVIQQLTDAFTQDVIGLEELERRLEQVYRTQSVAEAESLVADLRGAAAPRSLVARGADHHGVRVGAYSPMAVDNITAIFSSAARRGPWPVPARLEARAFFADATIDLRSAILPGDIIDIHVKVLAANMTIIVPPHLRVVNRVGAFLANVESSPALDLAPMVPGSPVVRITGYATMANLEIVDEATSEED